ncbi:MAG: SlyX family protein [Nitrospirota bacterium]|nr:SlyX family protein [Nitrospirota bacterium]
MESRLVDIELHIMQHEETIQQLNEVVITQQKAIDQLVSDVEFLKQKLRALIPADVKDLSEEVPPPHY